MIRSKAAVSLPPSLIRRVFYCPIQATPKEKNSQIELARSTYLCFLPSKKPATPLHDAQLGRYFFVLKLPQIRKEISMRFCKPAITLQEQVQRLRDCGLRITDHSAALTALENIGYYRLSAYTYPFREGTSRDSFKPETTLEQIIRVYDFDRELRLLVTDALERVEIGIRSRLVNHTCLYYAHPHWFMDASNFHPKFNHRAFLKKLESHLNIREDKTTHQRVLPTKHPETFIEHYYQKYADPYLPPFWMSVEVLTLGSLSHLFQGLRDSQLKKEIAAPFGVPAKIFSSWLHAISHLRNTCAHHGRLWNRKFSISPPIAKKHQGILYHPHRFEGHAVVIVEMLDACSPHHYWRQRLNTVLDAYPEIHHQAMGFPENWKSFPFWDLA
ncbi:MAG: Abi family protein [Verrucomicrobiales bacterium]